MRNKINNEFFNSFVYSVFKAIGERLGEGSWKIVWRTGEILFEEIKEKIGFEKEEPIEIFRAIAKYLKKTGYLKDVRIVSLNDYELEYWMKEPAIEKGAFKLIEEGFPPPHISTSILFSAIKNHTNFELKLMGNPEVKDKWIVERWKIEKTCSSNP